MKNQFFLCFLAFCFAQTLWASPLPLGLMRPWSLKKVDQNPLPGLSPFPENIKIQTMPDQSVRVSLKLKSQDVEKVYTLKPDEKVVLNTVQSYNGEDGNQYALKERAECSLQEGKVRIHLTWEGNPDKKKGPMVSYGSYEFSLNPDGTMAFLRKNWNDSQENYEFKATYK